MSKISMKGMLNIVSIILLSISMFTIIYFFQNEFGETFLSLFQRV